MSRAKLKKANSNYYTHIDNYRDSIKQRLSELEKQVELLSQEKNFLSGMEDLLSDLLKIGEARRIDRAAKMVKVKSINIELPRITGIVSGRAKSEYHPRITVLPTRGFRCDCPDWKFSGKKLGPCKHVLALVDYGLNKHIPKRLKEIREELFWISKTIK